MGRCDGVSRQGGAVGMKIKRLIALLAFCVAGCGQEPAADPVEGRGAETASWWEQLPRAEWSNFERVLTDETWFEVYRIFANVYAIYEPGQFEEVISFLIVGEDRALLFDTGLGIAPIAPVISRLTDRPVSVLNSHSHYDHIGGNHEFDDIAGIDAPYALARQAGAPNDVVREFIAGDWLPEPPENFDADAYSIQPYEIDGFVRDSVAIDLGGVRLDVLHTPGHSPDSICLLDRANRRLYTGDTFYLAPLYAHLEGSDFDQYAATANRLTALTPYVDDLITSHNVPVAGVKYLQAMADGFAAIKDKSAAGIETDGALEYSFDGFSIIAPKER